MHLEASCEEIHRKPIGPKDLCQGPTQEPNDDLWLTGAVLTVTKTEPKPRILVRLRIHIEHTGSIPAQGHRLAETSYSQRSIDLRETAPETESGYQSGEVHGALLPDFKAQWQGSKFAIGGAVTPTI